MDSLEFAREAWFKTERRCRPDLEAVTAPDSDGLQDLGRTGLSLCHHRGLRSLKGERSWMTSGSTIGFGLIWCVSGAARRMQWLLLPLLFTAGWANCCSASSCNLGWWWAKAFKVSWHGIRDGLDESVGWFRVSRGIRSCLWLSLKLAPIGQLGRSRRFHRCEKGFECL